MNLTILDLDANIEKKKTEYGETALNLFSIQHFKASFVCSRCEGCSKR